ncbi:uncharacterized protein HaLaN_16125 [Haematococcus lacustris]|uniref:Uncharacterized protein n=1 Tax=Haematococcus lacustris TaxID=44745 RepID=A0A699Z9B4_HAELA|nr:uncharacterized protein HaLaN_16125 [Haematococcus lacustris]
MFKGLGSAVMSPSNNRLSTKAAGSEGRKGAEAQAMRPVFLTFHNPVMEGEYLMQVAKSRWPVLCFVFCFDVVCFTFRVAASLANVAMSEGKAGRFFGVAHAAAGRWLWGCILVCMCHHRAGSFSPVKALVDTFLQLSPQLFNMALLYTFVGFVNRRSRKLGDHAARQEELLLSLCMAMAVCNLLASLTETTSQARMQQASSAASEAQRDCKQQLSDTRHCRTQRMPSAAESICAPGLLPHRIMHPAAGHPDPAAPGLVPWAFQPRGRAAP